MVGYAYSMEFFIAWYGANSYESFAFINRAFGNYWWAYWIMVSCNVISPQLFWFKAIRENTPLVWVISIFVNIGMWFERFVIANTTLSRDFLPSSWGYYSPTVVDIFTFAGTFGFFSVLFPSVHSFSTTHAHGRSKNGHASKPTPMEGSTN